MRFQPAMFHALAPALPVPAASIFESSAMHAPSIAALPTCTIFASGRFGNQPDALRRLDLQMPPETAGQIEDIDVVEVDAVVAEHHLQARDIRALGLRQFVDIAFQEVDARAPRRASIALHVVLEAAHRRSSGRCAAVRSSGRPGPSRRCPAARRRRSRRAGMLPSSSIATSSIAPSSAGMPQAIAPPSNAGPAGHDAARMRCLLPRINSVFVPMSMTATSRSSCARSTASMHAAASAPTWPLMIGAP